MRRQNYGFEKIERLPGNIGYLDLRGFFPPDEGGATAVAAMNVLSNSDAVIVDLRQNGGGDPSMIQLITTYFFDEPTHLNDLHWRTTSGERVDQFWTLPHVSGRRMPKVPLFVLTSKFTFSGGEEFANNLRALKRATLIGETTGGGANPGERFPLPAGFGVFIPGGRAVNPIDNSNWEGKGVEPHVKVKADDALATAKVAALEAIAGSAADPDAKLQAEWALEAARADLHPVQLAPGQLAAYAGTFGERRVTVEAGALFYQREGRSKLRLTPMTDSLFTVESVPYFRLRFVKDASGAITGVEGIYDDGRRDSSPRTSS
jgi:retinol-binding protein 3